MLTPESESKIRAAAIKQFTRNREACGLIIDGAFIEVPNTAENPHQDFRIEPQYLAVDGIQAIWHSHINDNQTLSPSDIIPCLAHQIPFILYLVKVNKFKVFDPQPNRDYLDREPCPGINDCWSLVDDWYRFELEIELPTFDRGKLITDGWEALNDADRNLFMSNIETAGFKRISLDEELKYGDVLLFQIGTQTISHAGVLVDSDELYFMHQLFNQPSRIDRLTGGWRDNLIAVARHKSI
jgi:proteasome lid subunit RPN8/RPN11